MSGDGSGEDFSARFERVRRLAEQEALGGTYVTAGPNFRWLTGQAAHPGGWPIWLSVVLVPTQGDPSMVISKMHAEIFDLEKSPIQRVFTYTDGEDPTAALRNAARASGVAASVLGVDSSTWIGDVELAQATGFTLRQSPALFDKLRAVKDAFEIEQLRLAARAHDAGYRRAAEVIRPGVTVASAGAEIVRAMVEAGSQELAIMGAFSQLTDRRFSTKEVVDVDLFPGSHGGYHADTARNIFIGEPTARERRLYDATSAAFESCLAAIRPGVPLEEIHRVCEDVMHDAGYEQVWKVGHGVGLGPAHEPPLLQRGNREPVEVGMVFTIDPGAFLERNTPIHIEDTVVVTADGFEALNVYPREMTVV